MEAFKIKPLSETELDSIIGGAGGTRAHPDADTRDKPGADYLLAETLIELKILDDEGLAKPERQSKLAALFKASNEDRPVIVLDRETLPADRQRDYERILEGPIKNAVKKGRVQLKQSKSEHPATTSAVLFVVNNGYTALDHDDLIQMVAHRVRQDTHEIDGVVVAGCYFYSDTFDHYFLWPIDYVPINITRPFRSFDALKKAWDAYSEKFMTPVVLGEMSPNSIKGPVVDSQFDIDGITFVKPAPPIGKESDFFNGTRPRKNSSRIETCPPVGITFPNITRQEWTHFQNVLPKGSVPSGYEDWQKERTRATEQGATLRPFVPVPVAFKEWDAWRSHSRMPCHWQSVVLYANEIFGQKLRLVLGSARERTESSILPSRYILAFTEVIGQDCANDVSSIVTVREIPGAEPMVRELVKNTRIFHEYALALACAYAVAEGVDSVLWAKNLRYAWI